MKIRIWVVLAAILGVALAAVEVLAHHSFAAEFDRNKPVTVTGTVTKVEWANPHARFFIDVKDEAGKVNNWDFRIGEPKRSDEARLVKKFAESRRCRHRGRMGCEKYSICWQYEHRHAERRTKSVRRVIGWKTKPTAVKILTKGTETQRGNPCLVG